MKTIQNKLALEFSDKAYQLVDKIVHLKNDKSFNIAKKYSILSALRDELTYQCEWLAVRGGVNFTDAEED